jgi:hypothetical protein
MLINLRCFQSWFDKLNILVMIYKNWFDNACINCFLIEKNVINYLLQNICCSMNMKMNFKSMVTLNMNKTIAHVIAIMFVLIFVITFKIFLIACCFNQAYMAHSRCSFVNACFTSWFLDLQRQTFFLQVITCESQNHNLQSKLIVVLMWNQHGLPFFLKFNVCAWCLITFSYQGLTILLKFNVCESHNLDLP